MRSVTVAWLAVLIAPADNLGVFVGLAVAAYILQSLPICWQASLARWCCRQCCATEVLHAILWQRR